MAASPFRAKTVAVAFGVGTIEDGLATAMAGGEVGTGGAVVAAGATARAVAGPERGRVWMTADVGAQPCSPGCDFLDWYERWLDGRPYWSQDDQGG